LVRDLALPADQRAIDPVMGLGFMGGDKFIVGAVFFKFARDSKKLFGSDTIAQKSAYNEIVGASAVVK